MKFWMAVSFGDESDFLGIFSTRELAVKRLDEHLNADGHVDIEWTHHDTTVNAFLKSRFRENLGQAFEVELDRSEDIRI